MIGIYIQKKKNNIILMKQVLKKNIGFMEN